VNRNNLILILWLALVVALHAAEDFLPRLNAVKFSSLQVRQGDTINVAYEFVNLGTSPAEEELTVFVHVRPAAPGDPDVKPAAGADFRPANPTFAWQPRAVAEERDHPIRIPKDFPPGQYRVFIGLYNPDGGDQFKLANDDLASGRRYRIAEIEVLPGDKTANPRPFEKRWHEAVTNLFDKPAVPEEAAIVIESGDFKVKLSANQPTILGYEWRDGRKLPGDATGYPLRARLGREATGSYRTVLLRKGFSLRQTAGEARYGVEVRDQGQLAASFDVVFRGGGNMVRADIENVREQPGFLLMDVWLPQLVSASGAGGELVIPTQSGRLIRLDRTAPGRHVIGLNWFESDLCGVVVGNGLAVAIRTRDWDNELEARVSQAGDQLAGGFAPRFALRADASTNDARMKLAGAPSVEVCLLGQSDTGANPTWVDAAKWLRRDLAGAPHPLYQDTFIYKIFCDSPGANDYTTFDEALEVIRKVHQLAPWMKQVVYLVGWQYRGHDTGYPATDQINQRLGGLDGLRRLAAEAAKLNAILSFHDNFDDAYRDSPQWDENVIARDTRGELQKGGVWAGGQSYILAFKKYAGRGGLERVRRTVAQMPVRGSYHIDVLSAVPLRRDYDHASPENSLDSLEGKFAIVREFNRLGIDVTSEGFTAPFVGVIGHGWHLWRDDAPVFTGDEAVPFIPMIYHGGPTTYGRGKVTATYARENALYGATFSSDWTKHTSLHSMAEAIYLVAAPWTYLRERKMQNYEKRDGLARVTYSADTFVEVNDKTGQWRVVVDGVPVVENELVVVRKSGGLAVYAQTARHAKISLPPALRNKPLKITNASTGEDLSARGNLVGAAVELDLPAREPVLIQ
jgi:hypothetical protein